MSCRQGARSLSDAFVGKSLTIELIGLQSAWPAGYTFTNIAMFSCVLSQEYRLKLAEGEILSQDTLHLLFLNLNAIVDFSRRILIGIEANASQPPELQRFGHLFVTMEHEFAVYEPYLVNFPEAQELALSLTKQENSPLSVRPHASSSVKALTDSVICLT